MKIHDNMTILQYFAQFANYNLLKAFATSVVKPELYYIKMVWAQYKNRFKF